MLCHPGPLFCRFTVSRMPASWLCPPSSCTCSHQASRRITAQLPHGAPSSVAKPKTPQIKEAGRAGLSRFRHRTMETLSHGFLGTLDKAGKRPSSPGLDSHDCTAMARLLGGCTLPRTFTRRHTAPQWSARALPGMLPLGILASAHPPVTVFLCSGPLSEQPAQNKGNFWPACSVMSRRGLQGHLSCV